MFMELLNNRVIKEDLGLLYFQKEQDNLKNVSIKFPLSIIRDSFDVSNMKLKPLTCSPTFSCIFRLFYGNEIDLVITFLNFLTKQVPKKKQFLHKILVFGEWCLLNLNQDVSLEHKINSNGKIYQNHSKNLPNNIEIILLKKYKNSKLLLSQNLCIYFLFVICERVLKEASTLNFFFNILVIKLMVFHGRTSSHLNQIEKISIKMIITNLRKLFENHHKKNSPLYAINDGFPKFLDSLLFYQGSDIFYFKIIMGSYSIDLENKIQNYSNLLLFYPQALNLNIIYINPFSKKLKKIDKFDNRGKFTLKKINSEFCVTEKLKIFYNKKISKFRYEFIKCLFLIQKRFIIDKKVCYKKFYIYQQHNSNSCEKLLAGMKSKSVDINVIDKLNLFLNNITLKRVTLIPLFFKTDIKLMFDDLFLIPKEHNSYQKKEPKEFLFFLFCSLKDLKKKKIPQNHALLLRLENLLIENKLFRRNGENRLYFKQSFSGFKGLIFIELLGLMTILNSGLKKNYNCFNFLIQKKKKISSCLNINFKKVHYLNENILRKSINYYFFTKNESKTILLGITRQKIKYHIKKHVIRITKSDESLSFILQYYFRKKKCIQFMRRVNFINLELFSEKWILIATFFQLVGKFRLILNIIEILTKKSESTLNFFRYLGRVLFILSNFFFIRKNQVEIVMKIFNYFMGLKMKIVNSNNITLSLVPCKNWDIILRNQKKNRIRIFQKVESFDGLIKKNNSFFTKMFHFRKKFLRNCFGNKSKPPLKIKFFFTSRGLKKKLGEKYKERINFSTKSKPIKIIHRSFFEHFSSDLSFFNRVMIITY